MEMLKALGYVPLLFLGKCSKYQKWTAEVQCPLEFPPEGHDLMEKKLIIFEHILQGKTYWQAPIFTCLSNILMCKISSAAIQVSILTALYFFYLMYFNITF